MSIAFPLRAAIAASAMLLVSSCASLVKPNVSAAPAALKAGEYHLDKKHAALLFKIGHLAFSKFVGRFDRFDASLDFDASAPENAVVDAAIDMTSLDVANPDFAATLTGPSWFDAAKFPEARFTTTRIEKTGETTGRMTGDLTLHGVTEPVTLDVVFNGGANDILRGGYVVGFSAKGVISRGEFGVDKFDGIVGDDVEIEIEAEFVKK